jgi:hypothetical protein
MVLRSGPARWRRSDWRLHWAIPAGAVGFVGLLLGVIAGGAPVLVVRRVQA